MIPRLLLLTDSPQLPPGRDLVATVDACAAAGLRAVVVRELDLPEERRAGLVAGLREIDGLTVLTAHLRLPGAHGVHLPATALCDAGFNALPNRSNAWEGRRTPRYMEVGVSCHSTDEVRRAAALGADYVTLSPFRESASKPGYGPRLDPADVGVDAGVPVLALGGIDAAAAAEARELGAHGVAVMGAVMRADDPAAVVADLLEAVGS